MKFSKRSTYGLRAMARLAKYWDVEFISLTELSIKEGISKKYLEQIFVGLKKAGLIESGKGKQGGYRLLRKPKDISAAEIIEALEEGISPSGCLSGEGELICKKGEGCGVVKLLVEIQKNTRDVLSKTSLKDIAKNHS